MQGQRAVLGWTVVRITFGLAMALAHGLPKVMDGMVKHTAGVAALGFPFPSFFAWASALTELVGGLLIAVGLYTRPAALLLVSNMAVALYRHREDPFSSTEKALLFFAVFVATLAIGSGPWSLDAKVRHRM